MQRFFQSAKRLISMCLVTLLLITSTLTIFPAPAQALGDIDLHDGIIIFNCQKGSNCGNLAAFAAGVFSGSAVTLIATGQAATLTAAGTAVASAATAATGTLAATGAAVASAAAAPLVVPVAAIAALGYVGYRVLQAHNHSQPKPSN